MTNFIYQTISIYYHNYNKMFYISVSWRSQCRSTATQSPSAARRK